MDPDRGLASERTSLAWQRSGLSLAATGAVVAKGLPGRTVHDHPLLGAVVAGLGLMLWIIVASSVRRRGADGPRRAAVRSGQLAMISASLTVIGLTLFAMVAIAG